ncbi:sugar phosphate permease [Desulfosporosinus acidiphilus SJ4]|uniref:Sugar phosphate permease n=1 Tax=Desulfosporosinus acidiphilus (strain DSM 22704 / JCM 16185 / SJ4) TaxID=646529 RepID=I4D664_DESAJ|nr:MFS transporter [Desulfosporosinus acidiphilus]AFM41288.1 sugar phosphate permease [Desulfosporosinus acidiphilus SJ4]
MNKTSVSDIIDQLGISKYTLEIYILVGLALLFDGFDYMIVAYTMPQMAKEWILSKVQTGSLASWSLLGLMVGGLVSGLISDHIGRKKTLISFVALYSMLTFPIYFVHSFEAFAFLRICSGIGLGACIPIAVTLMSESAPTKNRGYFTSSLMAFYILGWVVAGIAAMFIVPKYGWRVCYLTGGIPALYAIVLLFKLNESLYWLMGRGLENEAIKVLKKMEIASNGVAPDWAPGSLAIPPSRPKVGMNAVFSVQYRRATLANWIIYFMGSVVIYGITGWLPSLLVGAGYSLIKGYSFAILQNLFSILGALCTGYIADLIGRKTNVALGWLFTALAVLFLGYATNEWQVVICSITVGIIMNWALSGTQPLLTEAYPTEFRNTGVAWTQAFGRMGGFLGPIAAGYIQEIGIGFTGTFIFFAIPALIAAIAAFFLVTETKGKSIENVAGAKV